MPTWVHPLYTSNIANKLLSSSLKAGTTATNVFPGNIFKNTHTTKLFSSSFQNKNTNALRTDKTTQRKLDSRNKIKNLVNILAKVQAEIAEKPQNSMKN